MTVSEVLDLFTPCIACCIILLSCCEVKLPWKKKN